MFRKAVSTIEGYFSIYVCPKIVVLILIYSVKADSLFSYQPPINLIAVLLMLPASYVLTPRWFHKVTPYVLMLLYLFH